MNQHLGFSQRFLVAPLHVVPLKLPVHLCVLAAKFLDRFFGHFLKTGVTTKDMIKTPRNFTSEFHMWNLVGSHWHIARLINQDVSALQHRVAEKPIGCQVAVLGPGNHVLITWDSLYPGKRRYHGQHQVQFSVFRYAGLDKQGGRSGIHTCRQPVNHHLPDALFDNFRIFIVSRQGMPVSNEEMTIVFMLQSHPIFEHAMVVAKM